MRWLVLILLLSGCSKPEVVIDYECMNYYTGRIGLTYAKEVC